MYGYKKIISLLIPSFLEAASIVLLSIMNTMMVSHLGESAINAVNLASSPGNIVATVIVAIAAGITVKISQLMGKGKPLDAKRFAEQGSLLCLVTTVVLSLLMVLFSSPILTFLFDGLDHTTMEMARTFFVCIAFSLPGYALFHALLASLRGAGDFKIIFVAELLHNVLYLALGYLFIRVLHMEILGLGIALILCRTTGGGLLYLLLLRGTNCIRISNIFHRTEKSVLGGILSIGIPRSIDGFFGTGGALFLQTIIVSLGSTAITANALGGNLRNFFLLPYSAIGTVAVTLIAHAYGAGNLKEARRVMWRCTLLTVLIASVINLASIWYLKPLLGLYNASAETTALTLQLLTVTILFEPIFNTLNLTSWSALNAVGDVKFAITAYIIRFCIVRLLGSVLLTRVWHLGIHGIWYTMVADYVIASIIFTIRFLGRRWERVVRI